MHNIYPCDSKSQFLTDSCKFPTDAIAGAPNFNIASPNSPKMRDFQPAILYFWRKNFSIRRTFSDRLKFRGGGSMPPAAPIHDASGAGGCEKQRRPGSWWEWPCRRCHWRRRRSVRGPCWRSRSRRNQSLSPRYDTNTPQPLHQRQKHSARTLSLWFVSVYCLRE